MLTLLLIGSWCSISGDLVVFPRETDYTWLSGFDDMRVYKFGKQRLAHSFCPTCGINICGKSTDPNIFADFRAINVSQLLIEFDVFTPSSTLEFVQRPGLQSAKFPGFKHWSQEVPRSA